MRYRVMAIGCFEITALLAFVSPMIAYAMLAGTVIRWRTVYWFLCAFEACGLVLLVVCYKPPTFQTKHRADGKTRLQLLGEMDFVGIALFAVGCVLFLIGVNWVGRIARRYIVCVEADSTQGGRQYAWSSAPVVATIVVGALTLVVLGFWEAYADLKYPILPPKLFRKVREFTMVLVGKSISRDHVIRAERS